MARKIDVEELRVRRQSADIGWLKKSAKEMDILIDDESGSSDSDHFHGTDDEASGDAKQIKARRDLKHMKNSLKHLLEKPIFPKGFSYKYPGINSNEEKSNQNAVNVMKTAIEDNNIAKKYKKNVL